MIRENSDTDTGAHRNRFKAIQDEWLTQSLLYPLDARMAIRHILQIAEQENKLITTEPGHR